MRSEFSARERVTFYARSTLGASLRGFLSRRDKGRGTSKVVGESAAASSWSDVVNIESSNEACGLSVASLVEKSATVQSYGSYENDSGVASQKLKDAKNELYRAGLVLHDPKWSFSNQRHLSQSKEILYYLRVRSLREALASGTSGWWSHTSDLHL